MIWVRRAKGRLGEDVKTNVDWSPAFCSFLYKALCMVDTMFVVLV